MSFRFDAPFWGSLVVGVLLVLCLACFGMAVQATGGMRAVTSGQG